jgi:hypothetical protein
VKIQVLLLDNSFGPWHGMYQKGVLETWCGPSEKSIDFYLYLGKSPINIPVHQVLNKILLRRPFIGSWALFHLLSKNKSIQVEVQNKELRVRLSEFWPNIAKKTFRAIQFIDLQYEFDVLIRSNTTCYINTQLMRGYLEGKTEGIFYGGPVSKNKNFVSGWAIVLTKSAISILLRSIKKTDYNLFDDESIGQILLREGIRPVQIPFTEITSEKEVEELSEDIIRNTILYRVKGMKDEKRIDDVLMKKLHARIRETF